MATPNLQVASLAAAAVARFRLVSLLFAAALLAACANPPRDTASADQECVYVKVTGSNMPVRDCRPRAEREALAEQTGEAAQQGLSDLRRLEEFGVASPGADSLD